LPLTFGRSVPSLLVLATALSWAPVALAGGRPVPAAGQEASSPLLPADAFDLPLRGATPYEPDAAFYTLDWSLGLRGSYSRDGAGERYKAVALPSVTLTHVGNRLSFHGTADGQFSTTGSGVVNVDQARLSAGSALQFNRDASLATNASLAMTQESATASDVATDVATTPIEVSAAADATLSQKFGHLNLALRGNVGRNVFGATTLVNGTRTDNTSQNSTAGGAGLRLGFQLTPVLELFADGAAGRTVFDAPSTSLGTKLDGNLYTAKAGVAAKWNSTLEASASVGLGLEHFDDGSLADVTATLYDANFTLRPSETLTLTGDFATSIGAVGPNGSGSAKVESTATLGASYTVNPWLTWRASAGWHDARYADSSVTDTGYDLGVGADYQLSRHTRLSADYGFAHSQIAPNPATDTHTVSIGVTFQK
jgi:hypothetical protein